MTKAPDSRRLTVMLAAGGTGGHIFPAQALASALLARGHRVVLATDRRGAAFTALPEGVTAVNVTAGPSRGNPLTRGLALARGYLQAQQVLGRVKPDLVLGFGGYPSLPTVLAAQHRRLPVVLHEQNAVLGRANRLLAKAAMCLATGFPEVAGFAGRQVHVGNPVRAAIAAIGASPKPAADATLTLLITGGSQGAQVFASLIPDAIAQLHPSQRQRLRIMQQVRAEALETVRARYRALEVVADCQTFFEDMPDRLAAADLVIARAGASTIAELAAAGRPGWLLPYPHATDDHQTANATAFAAAGGGLCLPQASETAAQMAARLAALLDDPGSLTAMAAAAKRFARPGSADRLAELIEQFADHHTQTAPASLEVLA